MATRTAATATPKSQKLDAAAIERELALLKASKSKSAKKSDSYLEASELESDRARILEIMESDILYAEQIAAATAERKRLSAEMLSICARNDVVGGLKHGQLVVRYYPNSTKKTLSTTKLIMNGVKAQTIADSYEESPVAPYVKIEDLSKPRSTSYNREED